MTSVYKGYISFMETLGGLDGPGLRTVFFLQGCPLRCIYCHNPETQSMQGGDVYTVDKIVDIALRYKTYYGNHGGVTFSGGEPLVQRDFLIACADALHKHGICVTLDTSGAIFDKEALDKVDLVLLDVKHTDNDKYSDIVGCPMGLDNTIRTIEYLEQIKKRFWLRQVIVPNYNDNYDNIARLKELGRNAQKIELLPYHSMGKAKYQRLDMPYDDTLIEPSAELMGQLNKWLLS